jgi:hypothetical protein
MAIATTKRIKTNPPPMCPIIPRSQRIRRITAMVINITDVSATQQLGAREPQ